MKEPLSSLRGTNRRMRQAWQKGRWARLSYLFEDHNARCDYRWLHHGLPGVWECAERDAREARIAREARG